MDTIVNDLADIIEDLLDTVDITPGTNVEECAVITTFPTQTTPGGSRMAKYQIRTVPNRHEKPEDHFRIVQDDVALRPSERLVAVVHTHTRPNEPEPSYDDVKRLAGDLLGVVYHPPTGSWTIYNNEVGVLAFKDGAKK